MIIIGILLLIFEASDPGTFFPAIVGSVLITFGLIAVAVPELLTSLWTPAILAAVVIPLMFIYMKLYQRLSPPTVPTTTVSTSLIGDTGKVLVAVEPDSITGKVKLRNQIWSATSKRNIPAGSMVKVVDARGVHVVVDKINEKTTEDQI